MYHSDQRLAEMFLAEILEDENMTDRFKEAADDWDKNLKDFSNDDLVAKHGNVLRDALTLAQEAEQLRKERDELANDKTFSELYKFYNVDDVKSLVEAQLKQIDRLQERLAKIETKENFYATRTREG